MTVNKARGIVIRRAELADLPVVAALSKDTFSEAFARDNTPENMAYYLTHHFSDQALTGELKDPASAFFIAWSDGQAAGYIKLRSQEQSDGPDNALEIQRIYVLAAFQGKKVGAALMQYCLDTARQQAYEAVWLGVWEHNIKAISFYERWGFEVFGTHPFVFGDDVQTDLLMKRSV